MYLQCRVLYPRPFVVDEGVITYKGVLLYWNEGLQQDLLKFFSLSSAVRRQATT